jgi:hypothetical protein
MPFAGEGMDIPKIIKPEEWVMGDNPCKFSKLDKGKVF